MAKREKKSDYLPTGWAQCTVGDLASYVNGRAFKPSEWKDVGRPIIRIQNLNDPAALYNYSPEDHEEKYRIRRGDLLFAWSASLGAYIWDGEEAWLNQHIFRVDLHDGVDKRYVYYLLDKITAELYAKAHGSGMVHVTKGKFEETSVDLPPTAEQIRIVSKIDQLISELDQGIENLQTARDQLNVYRQAVLMHAFEGKLTERWREGNKDKLQTADDLRNVIGLNRQKRYERQLEDWKTAIKRWEDSGRQGKKPARPKKLKQLASLSDADKHADVPPNWCHTRLGSVIDEPKYGTSKKCDYGTDGIGVLRIPNVANGVVDPTDLKFAEFDEDETEVFGLQHGDILTIRSNGSISLVGKCALVSEEDEQYLFAGYLIRLRPHRCVVRSGFLNAVLSSHELRKQIESKAKSTSGVNNINSGEIQDLIIPICGLAEQDEVVRILDEKLSIIDQMQSDIRKQLSVSSALRQSILKRALSGQLVEQDPNDEPASELLARITAEKEERKKAKKAAKKKVKKKAKRKDAA